MSDKAAIEARKKIISALHMCDGSVLAEEIDRIITEAYYPLVQITVEAKDTFHASGYLLSYLKLSRRMEQILEEVVGSG